MSKPHRIGILLSGRGSNFLAIADSIAAGRIPNAEIAVVLSNKADAPGLAAARERGLTALAIEANGRKRAEHDAAIIAAHAGEFCRAHVAAERENQLRIEAGAGFENDAENPLQPVLQGAQ